VFILFGEYFLASNTADFDERAHLMKVMALSIELDDVKKKHAVSDTEHEAKK
jgi:hypothetical protein